MNQPSFDTQDKMGIDETNALLTSLGVLDDISRQAVKLFAAHRQCIMDEAGNSADRQRIRAKIKSINELCEAGVKLRNDFYEANFPELLDQLEGGLDSVRRMLDQSDPIKSFLKKINPFSRNERKAKGGQQSEHRLDRAKYDQYYEAITRSSITLLQEMAGLTTYDDPNFHAQIALHLKALGAPLPPQKSAAKSAPFAMNSQ